MPRSQRQQLAAGSDRWPWPSGRRRSTAVPERTIGRPYGHSLAGVSHDARRASVTLAPGQIDILRSNAHDRPDFQGNTHSFGKTGWAAPTATFRGEGVYKSWQQGLCRFFRAKKDSWRCSLRSLRLCGYNTAAAGRCISSRVSGVKRQGGHSSGLGDGDGHGDGVRQVRGSRRSSPVGDRYRGFQESRPHPRSRRPRRSRPTGCHAQNP